MTKSELRQSKEYADCINKIKGYPQGFIFTLNYTQMRTGQRNAMRIILHDAINEKLIESISFGVALSGEITDETFKRL